MCRKCSYVILPKYLKISEGLLEIQVASTMEGLSSPISISYKYTFCSCDLGQKYRKHYLMYCALIDFKPEENFFLSSEPIKELFINNTPNV